MPDILHILIIENDETDIGLYQDAIRVFNMGNSEYEITPTIKRTKDSGLEALTEKDWATAFIDLKLTTGNILKAEEGNDIVRAIYQKMRFPVYILTNTPNDVSKEFKQTIFLKISSKTDINYNTTFNEITGIYKTGILKILGKTGLIEEMLDHIFWSNISHTLNEWLNIENTEKSLLRYALTHLQEYLEISEDGKMFDIYHPIETYISPSIKEYFFTGDIINLIDNSSKQYIILSPACDMAPHGESGNPKVKDILICEIEPIDKSIIFSNAAFVKKNIAKAELQLNSNPADNGLALKIDSAKSEIEKIITNSFTHKHYYLPKTNIFDGGLINFQKISTIGIVDLKTKYENNVTITTQFVKDIVAKFSFYYSRQGSPDYDFKKLVSQYIS